MFSHPPPIIMGALRELCRRGIGAVRSLGLVVTQGTQVSASVSFCTCVNPIKVHCYTFLANRGSSSEEGREMKGNGRQGGGGGGGDSFLQPRASRGAASR